MTFFVWWPRGPIDTPTPIDHTVVEREREGHDIAHRPHILDPGRQIYDKTSEENRFYFCFYLLMLMFCALLYLWFFFIFCLSHCCHCLYPQLTEIEMNIEYLSKMNEKDLILFLFTLFLFVILEHKKKPK